MAKPGRHSIVENNAPSQGGSPSATLGGLRAMIQPGMDRWSELIALGQIALQHNLIDQAILAYEKAREIKELPFPILTNLAIFYQAKDHYLKAIAAYHEMTVRDPLCHKAYHNLGALLIAINNPEAAIAASRIAIALDPTIQGPYINLASGLIRSGDENAALEALDALLRVDPTDAAGLSERCKLRRYRCDWAGLESEQRDALRASARQGTRVPPFPIVISSPDPTEHLEASRAWSKQLAALGEATTIKHGQNRCGEPNRKLRIGYLSSDFINHATATLLAGIIELHDRDRFEIHGYDIGEDDGSTIRRRVVAAFDRFTCIRTLSYQDAGQTIADDGIDILIDLKGYTQCARTEIMATRPAPIQVNYLGYPGSMGALFIDYMITDAIVTPPGSESFYDEKLVRLPHCYQPNDRKRDFADEPMDRAAHGLPATGVVFCSFNDPYKITPAVWDIWMRLLAAVPDAVLWQLEGRAAATLNLRREAQARGVDPNRIVFAPKIENGRNLRRLGLADLFLDTLPVNGHTTVSDALWAGVPVLSCLGDAFPARVAGSLLHAVGLPELATTSLEEYERMALDLAMCPARLRGLRDRLAANRATTPLYDTARYVRNFEAALIRMAARHFDGQPPTSFTIAEAARPVHDAGSQA